MTDEQREHEVARRLRETGLVGAPDTLRPAVMREIRASSRRRAHLPWRGLTVAAAAAAAVALIAFGVTRLDIGAGSSSSAGGVSSGGGGAAGAQALRSGEDQSAPRTALHPSKVRTGPIVVGRTQARAILKPYLPGPRKPGTTLLPADTDHIVVRVPAGDLPQVRRALRLAGRSPAGPTVTVVLRPRR